MGGSKYSLPADDAEKLAQKEWADIEPGNLTKESLTEAIRKGLKSLEEEASITSLQGE